VKAGVSGFSRAPSEVSVTLSNSVRRGQSKAQGLTAQQFLADPRPLEMPSKRSVGCVSSVQNSSVLRTRELRSVAFVYGRSPRLEFSPKYALKRAFMRLRRAARLDMFGRINERLAQSKGAKLRGF
jgi:hypothetical protein